MQGRLNRNPRRCSDASDHHFPANRPIAHAVPPPPMGRTKIQTPRSHTSLLYRRRRCSFCSFRCNSSSASDGLGCDGPSGEFVWGGNTMERGFLKLCITICNQAGSRYVLNKARISVMLVKTLNICVGTKESRTTTA